MGVPIIIWETGAGMGVGQLVGISLGADEGWPEGIDDGTEEILGLSLGCVEGALLG